MNLNMNTLNTKDASYTLPPSTKIHPSRIKNIKYEKAGGIVYYFDFFKLMISLADLGGFNNAILLNLISKNELIIPDNITKIMNDYVTLVINKCYIPILEEVDNYNYKDLKNFIEGETTVNILGSTPLIKFKFTPLPEYLPGNLNTTALKLYEDKTGLLHNKKCIEKGFYDPSFLICGI